MNSQSRFVSTAVLMLAIACASPDATSPIEADLAAGPIALAVVSGNGQTGVVGTELPLPLVVKVTDNKGKGVEGLTVNFRVIGGGGSVWAGAATTDASGNAQDYWTLGTSITAVQQVEVRTVAGSGVKSVHGVFTANAIAGSPASLTLFDGDGQSGIVGGTLGVAPSVRAADDFGNPVGGVAVTFTVTMGGGTVVGATPTTNSNGLATVGSWTLGAVRCDNTLTVVAIGLSGSPLAFKATAIGNCWRTLAPMPTARFAHRVAVVNGMLYAVGGVSAAGAILATVESYDPVTNTWTSRTPMPTARASMQITVANGLIYAIGGSNGDYLSTVEAYDPTSDSWSTRAPMPLNRYELAGGVAGGRIYAMAGWNNVNAGGYLTAVESYDPTTNSWASAAFMPTPRYALAVGAVNGILYAVGGENSLGFSSAVEAYNASSDQWTAKAAMPTPRFALGVGVTGGLLYAVGGRSAAGRIATLEVYNPSSNSWTTKTPMPTAREAMAVAAMNGIVYAIGGNSGSPFPNFIAIGTTEAYRP